jgi:DnaJ-class molecular chaperone
MNCRQMPYKEWLEHNQDLIGKTIECSRCMGEGVIDCNCFDRKSPLGDVCELCDGTGIMNCPNCHGTGEIEEAPIVYRQAAARDAARLQQAKNN